MTVTVSSLQLTNVPGFFLQDLEGTDPDAFDYITSDFGLSLSTGWSGFKSAIEALNADAPSGTSYRVIYLARHGQGYHNVAEEYYGTGRWNEYWSKLDGDGKSVWADAELTPVGIQEAKNANVAWKTQITKGVPLPQSYYSSPMRRSLHTAEITWGDIVMDKGEHPLIVEKLRETLGVHTCDRRSTKTVIAGEFPKFRFEEPFTEEDELWVPDVRETNAQRNQRLKEALTDIMLCDKNTYLSISAHSGVITSVLEVLGHRVFKLQTGGMIPVVVKVENIEG